MIKLLKKEMNLTASLLSYIFLAFSVMTLIPNYPILVGTFFICLGIFQTFQKAREANDTLYSALLPVKKTDIVKARFLFTFVIQAAGLVLLALFSVLRVAVLNKTAPYLSGAMMNSNLAYLGYVMLIFAWFNIFFVGGFYKTAYKIGMPFLTFGIIAFVTVIVCEALHFFPGLEVLNYDFHWSHCIVVFVGAAVYIIGSYLSLRKAQHNFDKIDL